MELTNKPAFAENATVGAALGVGAGAQFRFAMLKMPTTGLMFEVMDYKGIDRKTVRGDLQDPGSTRFQMQVRDIDAAVAAFTKAGGAFVSTGGKPLELPAPNGALKVGIVRDAGQPVRRADSVAAAGGHERQINPQTTTAQRG